MDEGQWQSEGPVRRGGVGDSELQNEVGSAHSPDQNQNRLLEEGEEVEQGPRGGQKLLQQDSANNNGRDEDEDEGSRVEEEEEEEEEMDNNSGACSPDLDRQLRDSPSLSPSPTVCDGPLSPEEIPSDDVLSPRELTPSLAAALQTLEEQGDHALLPHCLHQIAEALVLEGDYARAVRFIHLQRLYHERVLSNLATLQEQWENRWRVGGQCLSSSSVGRTRAPPPPPPPCDMDTEHLEKLRHICRTHRQPAQSAERCDLVVKAQRNNVMSVKGDRGNGTCGAEKIMEEQDHQDGLSPKQDTTQPEESGSAPLGQQGAPKLHMPLPCLPTSSLSTTPSSAVSDSPSASGGEENTAVPHPAAPSTRSLEETQPSRPLREPAGPMEGGREPAGPMEGGREPADTGQDPSWEKGEETVPPTSQEEVEGRRKDQEQLGLEVPEENPEDQGLEELEGEDQGLEELEVGTVTTLDDLAKRIQVEEITPAAGLVSILKRRGSLEGATTPPVPKPGGKRKVRFRVPGDGLDHEEEGGDSWLLLLLLCLATVVISVGGTALYCTFGDAKSSVCTDFSHNVDFYIGQVQRGVDELRHWFSPGS